MCLTENPEYVDICVPHCVQSDLRTASAVYVSHYQNAYETSSVYIARSFQQWHQKGCTKRLTPTAEYVDIRVPHCVQSDLRPPLPAGVLRFRFLLEATMIGNRFYQTGFWRQLRRRALERDGGRCVTPGCPSPGSHVDHIVPRRRGGPDALANLRSLCPACHNRVTRSGNRIDPRAVGCDANGIPLDPGHHWRSG
jgi:hypothetical protein